MRHSTDVERAAYEAMLAVASTELVEATEAERLRAENNKLRELLDGCAILLTDSDFMHWPELRDETLQRMRELGMEVD